MNLNGEYFLHNFKKINKKTTSFVNLNYLYKKTWNCDLTVKKVVITLGRNPNAYNIVCKKSFYCFVLTNFLVFPMGIL